jgi:DNA helicase-2/ATP-dependent DNA helicase PcrA
MAERSWDPDAFAAWTPPPRARLAHASLSLLLTVLSKPDAAGGERTVSEEIAALRAMYDDILRERYDRAEPRLADLAQLEVIAGSFPNRAAFLSELALEPPSKTQDFSSGPDTEDDALILSTAHSAKGREWDAVFIIWAVDGWFPSNRSLGSDEDTEEERRLMYVAMTRARKHLTVSYPLNAYQSRYGTEYSVDQLTRFIDPGVRELMTRVAAMPETLPSAAPSPFTGEPVDLRALLRGRFGAG